MLLDTFHLPSRKLRNQRYVFECCSGKISIVSAIIRLYFFQEFNSIFFNIIMFLGQMMGTNNYISGFIVDYRLVKSRTQPINMSVLKLKFYISYEKIIIKNVFYIYESFVYTYRYSECRIGQIKNVHVVCVSYMQSFMTYLYCISVLFPCSIIIITIMSCIYTNLPVQRYHDRL